MEAGRENKTSVETVNGEGNVVTDQGTAEVSRGGVHLDPIHDSIEYRCCWVPTISHGTNSFKALNN